MRAVACNAATTSSARINQAQVGVAGSCKAVGARGANGTDAFPETRVPIKHRGQVEAFERKVGVMWPVVDAEDPLHADGEMPAPEGPGD